MVGGTLVWAGSQGGHLYECMVSSQYVSLQGCFFWELYLQPDCVGLLAGHQEGEVNVPSAEYLNLKSQFIGLMTFFFPQ